MRDCGHAWPRGQFSVSVADQLPLHSHDGGQAVGGAFSDRSDSPEQERQVRDAREGAGDAGQL